LLIVVALSVVAALAALSRGGSLEALSTTKLRWAWLLIIGLVVQSALALWAPSWIDGPVALLVLVLGNLAIVLFIAGNRMLPGMLLADIGVGLNLLVIVLNGAMPVSASAARVAGIEEVARAAGISHEVMNDETVLPWFGDVIPVPYAGEVWSVGDIFLATGIARLVYARTASGETGKGERPIPAPRAFGSQPAEEHAPRRSRRRRGRGQSPRRAWSGLDR
jgi:Family of unknown function (DUF5317)